jgi:hypothetical protein
MLYATYASGLSVPVERLLNGSGCDVRQMLDGAVVYERREVKILPAFNNVYKILVCEKWKGHSLDGFMRNVLNGSGAWRKQLRFCETNETPGIETQTFRIVTSVENKLVSVNGGIKTQLEAIIATATGLVPDRGGSGYEYLFLLRSEGYAFFLKRLTYHTAHEKVLQKGELRPELCYLLNYMTEPSPSDVVLDPFCGCGGIAAARAQNFPFRAVYASDTDLSRVKKAPRVVYREADISKLHEWLPAASVDKIVTDPPWGLYDTDLNIAELYATIFAQFERVLTSDGVIVLLTAQKELTRRLLQEPRFNLNIMQAYDILVSGKKAGVFVIKKSASADNSARCRTQV